MSLRLHIRVDHGRCVSNAMCVAFAPGVFKHNPDRQSEVVNPDGESVETVLEAAVNCPTGAISVEDTETGAVLFAPET